MGTPTKCRYANSYKGRQPPKCGCDICALKWENAELRRDLEAMKRLIGKKLDATDCYYHLGH